MQIQTFIGALSVYKKSLLDRFNKLEIMDVLEIEYCTAYVWHNDTVSLNKARNKIKKFNEIEHEIDTKIKGLYLKMSENNINLNQSLSFIKARREEVLELLNVDQVNLKKMNIQTLKNKLRSALRKQKHKENIIAETEDKIKPKIKALKSGDMGWFFNASVNKDELCQISDDDDDDDSAMHDLESLEKEKQQIPAPNVPKGGNVNVGYNGVRGQENEKLILNPLNGDRSKPIANKPIQKDLNELKESEFKEKLKKYSVAKTDIKFIDELNITIKSDGHSLLDHFKFKTLKM